MPRTKKKQTLTEQVTSTSKRPVPKPEKIDTSVLVPTGSTLLNLACSDRSDGGFALGRMVNVIGDSDTGKTLKCLSIFAECCRLKYFSNYRFFHDDTERKRGFNIREMFGLRAYQRIVEPPNGISDTIQQFQDNLYTALDDEKGPFIYALDSFDALSCEEEQEKAEQDMAARLKGDEIKGSYNMAKPKAASQLFRLVCSKLEKTKSVLIIVSQTRDDINPMTFTKKKRSGGNALYFYATHEMWLAVAKQLKKKGQIIGSYVKAKVSKNHLTGKKRVVEFPIYTDYGLDDVGSCVDFLVREDLWEKEGKTKILAPDFDFEGTRGGLIDLIENNNLESKLTKLVAKTWKEIEDSLKLNRKPKYK